MLDTTLFDRSPSNFVHRTALIAIGSLLLSGCGLGNRIEDRGLTACRLAGVDREVLCGSLTVPEDPDRPAGRSIEVHFAVVPAVARNREPDPIVVLAGGPGQAAMQIAGQTLPLFARLNARRDIVYIDQRGTGKSNALNCPDDDDSIGVSIEPTRQIERVKACVAKLPGDSAQYATWIAVRDFEAIRKRLGAPQLNLWGASYGTRVALEYLRQFPDRVRTVVLDGVAPPDMALPAAAALDADSALDRLIALCHADAMCGKTYPDFASRLGQLLERAENGFDVSIAHPVTGRVERLRIDRPTLAALVRTPLYLPPLSSMLPFALTEAGAGNFAPLIALSLSVAGNVRENLSVGMHLAVVCAEDQPIVGDANRSQASRSRFGAGAIDLYAEACRVIETRPVPAAFRTIDARSVPVLVLSGALDPATPPRYGEAVAARLGNAKHLVAPHLSHGVSGQACAPELIARFIRDASFKRVNGECLARIPPSTFFRPFDPIAAKDIQR